MESADSLQPGNHGARPHAASRARTRGLHLLDPVARQPAAAARPHAVVPALPALRHDANEVALADGQALAGQLAWRGRPGVQGADEDVGGRSGGGHVFRLVFFVRRVRGCRLMVLMLMMDVLTIETTTFRSDLCYNPTVDVGMPVSASLSPGK